MNDLLDELRMEQISPSTITVAGIGGGGGAAVTHMYEVGITGVNFLLCNTDKQALDKSPIKRKIVLGHLGLGAGNKPKRAYELAMESLDEIRDCLESLGTEMLFITAGMGGGTGTGASPVIAKLAREMGILTVAIVTTPNTYEGALRLKQAEEGIEELKRYVDSILVIKNDNITKVYGKDALYSAFHRADEVLTRAAKGIAEVITVYGHPNVDFADVKNVLMNSGRVHLSVARAEGANRMAEVVERSLHDPLMEKTIAGARDVIINLAAANFSEGEGAITGAEHENMINAVRESALAGSTRNDVNVIWGATEKPELGNAVEMLLIATNFDESVESRSNNGGTLMGEDASTVVLHRQNNRYSDIKSVLEIPAYQRRNYTLIFDSSAKPASDTMRPRTRSRSDASSSAAQGSSLFDNENDK